MSPTGTALTPQRLKGGNPGTVQSELIVSLLSLSFYLNVFGVLGLPYRSLGFVPVA